MNLYSIDFGDTLNGWIVGDFGTLIKSVDAGLSWNLQSNGTPHAMKSVFLSIMI